MNGRHGRAYQTRVKHEKCTNNHVDLLAEKLVHWYDHKHEIRDAFRSRHVSDEEVKVKRKKNHSEYLGRTLMVNQIHQRFCKDIKKCAFFPNLMKICNSIARKNKKSRVEENETSKPICIKDGNHFFL